MSKMPNKRMQPASSTNNLYLPAQQHLGTKPSPSLPNINRSASPSGLSNFFSRPTKWFNRTNSAPRPSLQEPRASTSSITTQRRPTISGPTDPRPIPSSPSEPSGSLGISHGNLATRSVLDLSMLGRVSTDHKATLELPPDGLGDLRAVSRKGWSVSADNLSVMQMPKKLKPLDTTMTAEQRMKIEQFRAGASPATPVSSPSSSFKHYPFPTAAPSTPKKSDTSDSLSDMQPLAHVRSRSHTPAANASSRLAIPSPQQHLMRKKSTDGDVARDKVSSPGTPTRAAFLFPFTSAAASNSKAQAVPPTTVPVVIEPESEPVRDESKRASQIVHRSGFVMRLPDFTPSYPQLSSKKWKPFKLVLQGSKLYFYKPPSDRSAAIKELFPSTLVAVIEQAMENSEEENLADESTSRSYQNSSKRKRVFWGRRRHPELTVVDGAVEKGQWEALIHEAVFGTTFRDDEDITLKLAANNDWKQFASSVLLSVPYLMDRGKAEAELVRYASYLVNGANESEREEERSRVLWMATEYTTYHGSPVDAQAWEIFIKEIIPSFSPPLHINTLPPQSFEELSPDIDAFSPRPADAEKLPTFASLASMSQSTSQIPASPAKANRIKGHTRALDLLESEGFSREIFLRLDASTIAGSLALYHRALLNEGSSAPFSKVLFGSSSDSCLAEFFGSDEYPHWLTRLVIRHILGPNTPSAAREDDKPTSRTHVRSDVIGRWAKVGEICRLTGDECSWRSIMAALCSKAVARLEKAWKRTDTQAVATVRAWVYPSSTGESMNIVGQRTTPWGGDNRQRVSTLLSKVADDQTAGWIVKPMKELKELYDRVRVPFFSCTKDVFASGDEEEIARLQVMWRDVSAEALPSIPHIDQYMDLSFAAEPRGKCRFTPHYWARQPGSQGLQTLLPLAFIDPLPTIALIDRSQIVRTKKLSNELGPLVADVHTYRIADLKPGMELPESILTADGLPMHGQNSSRSRGTDLSVFDGDLQLLVEPAEVPSKPLAQSKEVADNAPTRVPSIRVRPGAAGLERKASRIRRSSMPVLSKRPSIIGTDRSSELPIRCVVKAGTLDQLVSLLAHGLNAQTVAVIDDNGEMALSNVKNRSVRVDRMEFANIWWNVFRSFVSPLVLFELLRKIYLSILSSRASVSSREVIEGVHHRIDVIETISDWITKGGGAQDALDDVELHSAMLSFLSSPEDTSYMATIQANDELKTSIQVLDKARESLLDTFRMQTQRPQHRLQAVRASVDGAGNVNYGVQPPLIDSMTAEELVNNLDAMAGATYRNLVQEDLYVASDILEVQTADRVAWFLSQDPFIPSEDVEITTLYTHLLNIEPTSMAGEKISEVLYRILPPGVRSLLRAYVIARKWIICQLVAPNIGLKTRQSRMELVLQAIELSRLRSVESQVQDRNVIEVPCIRSFVEAVLSSAVVSPESRLFQRAWMNVAAVRKVGLDSLASLLAKRTVDSVSTTEKLTVDPAWFLERMLEIISLPDVLDSKAASQCPSSLVNFEKRRHLYNLFNNASSLTGSRGSAQRREADRWDYERLNNLETDMLRYNMDPRLLREEAQREAFAMSPQSTPNSKRSKPFQKLVLAQQEKNKRDKIIRDRLLKERRLEQQRHERREEDINRAMDIRKANHAAAQKNHRSKKSMSAFFRVMRPISTAFTGDTGPQQKRTPAELDFKATSKPALVISLVDARVASYINNERSFTFQIDTEDGGHYLIQAMDRPDMNKWLAAMNNAITSYAERRLTYMRDTPKPQLADHIHFRPKASSQDPRAVFGVEIEQLLRREAGNADFIPGAVPRVIEICLSEIERRGLSEPGIYRVAGASSEVNALKESLNRGMSAIDPITDIHAVCDVVKFWLRNLPEPVFPESFYQRVVDAARIPNLDDRLKQIREVVQVLPRAHFYLLQRLVEHFEKVSEFEEKNHMSVQNLAITISPNLVRAPQDNFAIVVQNMGQTHMLFKALILHSQTILTEADDGELEENEEEDEDEGSDSSDTGNRLVDDILVEEPEADDTSTITAVTATLTASDSSLQIPGTLQAEGVDSDVPWPDSLTITGTITHSPSLSS